MKLGHSSCRILLDDAQSTSNQPTSRLYSNPISYLSTSNTGEIESILKRIQQYLASQHYVVANFSYELGEYFQGLTPKKSLTPMIEAWVFDNVTKLSKLQVDKWLRNNQAKQDNLPSGVTGLASNIEAKEFESKIKHIHELIRCGDTYQVNYTYRIKGKAYGDPLSIYESLREKQPGPFGAYIEKSDGWLLSCSPEIGRAHV